MQLHRNMTKTIMIKQTEKTKTNKALLLILKERLLSASAIHFIVYVIRSCFETENFMII